MSQPKMVRKDWRGAIIGIVLGDGSLYQNPYKDGSKRGNYKMDIGHSVKQKEYLLHKKNIVNDIFNYNIPVTYKTVQNSKTNKSYPIVKFQTRTNSRLSFIAKNIYINGTKRITDWALDNITEEGLAYWWMDDGCLSFDPRPNHGGGSVIWGTYGFPEEDVTKFQGWLFSKYSIRLNKLVHRDGSFYLRKGLSDGSVLLNKLKTFSIPSMNYKFDYSKAFKRPVYKTKSFNYSAVHPIKDDDIVHTTEKSVDKSVCLYSR
jgi:hypothetical protein